MGAPPGTVEAPKNASETRVRVLRYDVDSLTETEGLDSLSESGDGLVWVDVTGLGSLPVIEAIGRRFDLHPLALEDVVHLHQRAKVEEYDKTMFILARMVRLLEDGTLDVEQVSFFLGDGFVVTFQEREGDSFEHVRQRLRDGRGRIRRQGADYLAYALLDALVDSMFPILEAYGDRLDQLEVDIFDSPSSTQLQQIHVMKRELREIRRAVWPLREVLSVLLREEFPQISDDVRLYLRDCSDHVVQVVELVESHRELASSLHDAYLSSVGNRTNEVMKVLTMSATVFIPLSFLVGLYGMNFDSDASPYNMPELRWAYGYPALLAVMVSMVLGMVIYFRRKRWIGEP